MSDYIHSDSLSSIVNYMMVSILAMIKSIQRFCLSYNFILFFQGTKLSILN